MPSRLSESSPEADPTMADSWSLDRDAKLNCEYTLVDDDDASEPGYDVIPDIRTTLVEKNPKKPPHPLDHYADDRSYIRRLAERMDFWVSDPAARLRGGKQRACLVGLRGEHKGGSNPVVKDFLASNGFDTAAEALPEQAQDQNIALSSDAMSFVGASVMIASKPRGVAITDVLCRLHDDISIDAADFWSAFACDESPIVQSSFFRNAQARSNMNRTIISTAAL
ncbi:hypothetical protein KCU93_g8449, partial [Aureobasidium melanogenum]